MSLGQDASVEALYNEYAPMVRRVLYRLGGGRELDDLVQDTFVKAIRAWPSFDGRSSVKTWLTRIAVNTAHDSGRRQQVRQGTEAIGDVEELEGRSRDPALALAIHQAVSALPEEGRSAFVLVVMEGFTAAEAAEILDCPAGTVRSRVQRARDRVREQLSAHQASS